MVQVLHMQRWQCADLSTECHWSCQQLVVTSVASGWHRSMHSKRKPKTPPQTSFWYRSPCIPHEPISVWNLPSQVQEVGKLKACAHLVQARSYVNAQSGRDMKRSKQRSYEKVHQACRAHKMETLSLIASSLVAYRGAHTSHCSSREGHRQYLDVKLSHPRNHLLMLQTLS